MSTNTIIEFWTISSLFGVLLYCWMLLDTRGDRRAATEARQEFPDEFGPELLVLARMNVARECMRIAVGLCFLGAGYLAWDRPAWGWLPNGSTIYLLLAGNVLFQAKAILDRALRILVRRALIERMAIARKHEHDVRESETR